MNRPPGLLRHQPRLSAVIGFEQSFATERRLELITYLIKAFIPLVGDRGLEGFQLGARFPDFAVRRFVRRCQSRQ